MSPNEDTDGFGDWVSLANESGAPGGEEVVSPRPVLMTCCDEADLNDPSGRYHPTPYCPVVSRLIFSNNALLCSGMFQQPIEIDTPRHETTKEKKEAAPPPRHGTETRDKSELTGESGAPHIAPSTAGGHVIDYERLHQPHEAHPGIGMLCSTLRWSFTTLHCIQ